MNAHAAEQSFHTNIDENVRAYQNYKIGTGWGPVFSQWLTLYSADLAYRFYPHYHPFVKQLALKLVETDSVPQMLTMDIQYQANSDGSYEAVPGSTRAVFQALPGGATPVLGEDGKPLLPGAPMTLADASSEPSQSALSATILPGASLLFTDGTTGTLDANLDATLSLPIPIPNFPTAGVQITVPAGTSVIPAGSSTAAPLGAAKTAILPDKSTAALKTAAKAYLSSGYAVTLPAATTFLLRSGLPLPALFKSVFSSTAYDPSSAVLAPFPVENLDFSQSGAYSAYNWELFFHAPLLIAIHLSRNQQFQDAQTWFHTIFDPTDDSDGPTPARFWKVTPFQYTDAQLIQQVLLNLSTGQDPQLQKDTQNSIRAWIGAPFQPFVVAQYRPTAYMLKTVMAYLDNLIAWGDSLFAQYTIETINEATQIYVLAAQILGAKPQQVPVQESTAPQTYAGIRPNLDDFSNALVDMEVDIPFDLGPSPAPSSDPTGPDTLTSVGQTLFFCVPRNTTLLGYWDTVADRLFKIHNSLNLQGVFQKLPLFDPPIDPALLVRAAAEGLDVSAIVSGLNQPLPLVRFRLLVQKAAEICQEAISLGNQFLAAMEKDDNEALSLLRAQHESILMNLNQAVKYAQWQETAKNRQGLEQTLANAVQRYTYYQQLLGYTASQIKNNIPQLAGLDTGTLATFNFSQAGEDGEPRIQPAPVTVDISRGAPSVSDGEVKTLSSHEVEELRKLSDSQDHTNSAQSSEGLAASLGYIPDFSINVQPMGVGVSTTMGGTYVSKFPAADARGDRAQAEVSTYEANQTAKIGTYSRRELDWLNQGNLALGEINLAFRQLRAAQIREYVADREYRNHLAQMQQSRDIQDFLQGTQLPVGNQGQYQKTTTVGFYLWMKGAVQGLYNNAFQLAFATARKAEQAMQQELGNPGLSYLRPNYLDGMEGLLAGEKLLYDVKRMEMDYHDLNVREYEMTKHVSLLQVDPRALLQLRATGTCTVQLPEELFDLDGPGHYFRRIKSVALTIPCVTGPYVGVHCTLALQNSSIRTSPQVQGAGYPDAKNFSAYYGTLQAVVTSSGQDDSGLFEANLHDERYLPFEYSGAVSQWQLTLPADLPQFDFRTITDVILHLRYTAREGGNILKAAVVKNLEDRVKAGDTVGSKRLFSVRHEFPTEWAKFKSGVIGGGSASASLALMLKPQHYPYWAQSFIQGNKITVKAVELYAELPPGSTVTSVHLSAAADMSNPDALNQDPSLGGLLDGSLSNVPLSSAVSPTGPDKPFTVYLDDNSMKDLWLEITWGHA